MKKRENGHFNVRSLLRKLKEQRKKTVFKSMKLSNKEKDFYGLPMKKQPAINENNTALQTENKDGFI
jgi:hypothetical protein